MTPSGGAKATWSAATTGEHLWFVGTLATIRIPGEAVDRRFALIEFLFPYLASPPRHTHPQDESYVVLDGRLTIEAGEELERVFEAHGQVNVGPPLGPDD